MIPNNKTRIKNNLDFNLSFVKAKPPEQLTIPQLIYYIIQYLDLIHNDNK